LVIKKNSKAVTKYALNNQRFFINKPHSLFYPNTQSLWHMKYIVIFIKKKVLCYRKWIVCTAWTA